jgi:acid phosphatase type 7
MTQCTLAYWHHPRFSSGQHGDTAAVAPLWQALYEAGAEIVLSGHDHNYERFAPQTAGGSLDAARGIRQFVVGTGGKNHYALSSARPNSEVRDGDTFGVLKLTLGPSSYSWQFIPESGKTFSDSGSANCH